MDSRQCPEPFHGKKFNAAEIEDEGWDSVEHVGDEIRYVVGVGCIDITLDRDDRRDRMPLTAYIDNGVVGNFGSRRPRCLYTQ